MTVFDEIMVEFVHYFIINKIMYFDFNNNVNCYFIVVIIKLHWKFLWDLRFAIFIMNFIKLN